MLCVALCVSTGIARPGTVTGKCDPLPLATQYGLRLEVWLVDKNSELEESPTLNVPALLKLDLCWHTECLATHIGTLEPTFVPLDKDYNSGFIVVHG